MDVALKVATPATALTEVPVRVPPAGLVPIASVTVAVLPVTMLPSALADQNKLTRQVLKKDMSRFVILD